MGYLDNSSITVDAILTKRGRELLARNDGSFRVTQFALGDDEIDYTLFNSSHPNGTQYAAEAIENMPLIEAMPNGKNALKSKLITLNRGAHTIPYIHIANYGEAQNMQTIVLNSCGSTNSSTFTVAPTTHNFSEGTEDYVFTILNENAIKTFGTVASNAAASAGIEQDLSAVLNEFTTIETNRSVRGSVLTGKGTENLSFFPTNVSTRSTSIIVEGVSSGAIVSIPVTLNKVA